uniref:Uncharacterized protein n=1 Tax=Tanacetum cinerariifolium TaxID=118510 RepID=A0A6L2LHS3_TANCI|nr:hypothetical protein [Tanacetum cinerariifolium]
MNYMKQPMQNPKDISDPTTAIDTTLALMAKAFTLNNTTLTNNNQKSSSNPSNMQIASPGMNMDQDRHMLMVEDNVGNQFRPNVVQNVRNQISQEEEAGIQSTQEEFKFMAAADASEENERVKTNCILENNLQQASTPGTQSDKALVYDSNESAEAQTKTIIDSLQTKLHDTIYKNAKLRAQLFDKVSKQKDTTHETSTNNKFAKQSILGKLTSSSRPKLYVVTPLRKSKAIPKIDESYALSKLVTSNLVPIPTESKVVKNDNVISSEIFRINHFKASRVDNFVPNKHVKPSVMTKPITVPQPHVITKNDVNSKTNGFSPKDVKSTARNRRPLLRNNPKNDKSWKVYLVICSMNYSNGENQFVLNSSAVTTADTSDKRQQQQDSTSSTSTLATTITADGNFDW